MDDQITVIPMGRRRPQTSLVGAILGPEDVHACVSCVSLLRQAPVHDESAVLVHAAPGNMDAVRIQDWVRDLVGAVQTATDPPDVVRIEGPEASRLYVACVIAGMVLYLYERRTVVFELVDPQVQRLPGWSKGYLWRRQGLRNGGLSPLMLQALAVEVTTAMESWQPARLAELPYMGNQ